MMKSKQEMAYRQLRDTLVFRVMPEGSVPEDVPYERICGDMAVICCAEICRDARGSATATISNAMLEAMGIDAEQLFRDTEVNAPKVRPPQVRSMRNALEDLAGEDLDIEETPLIVAGTHGGVSGAAVIRYPGFLEGIAERIGSFFLIPSSVHEVLLMPEKDAPGVAELNQMIWAINHTEVLPEDRLSDTAYYYDAGRHALEVA